MLTLCCSTPGRGLCDESLDVVELTLADTPAGLGACSIKPQAGDVLVDVASNEQLCAPGLGRLPAVLLPVSKSKPERTNKSTKKQTNKLTFATKNPFQGNPNKNEIILVNYTHHCQ